MTGRTLHRVIPLTEESERTLPISVAFSRSHCFSAAPTHSILPPNSPKIAQRHRKFKNHIKDLSIPAFSLIFALTNQKSADNDTGPRTKRPRLRSSDLYLIKYKKH